MDLLGVGPLELVFVLLLIFLVIGPNDMAVTGKKIGRFLSAMKKSDFWKGVNQITKEVRTLPTTLMREAELEDVRKELDKDKETINTISKEFKADEIPDWQKSARQELSPQPSTEDKAESLESGLEQEISPEPAQTPSEEGEE